MEAIPETYQDTIVELESRMTLNTDTISLKQSLADYMIHQKRLPILKGE